MEWININDRMPLYGQIVLAYPISFDSVNTLRVYNDGYGNSKFEIYDKRITHWMPLPKPPQT